MSLTAAASRRPARTDAAAARVTPYGTGELQAMPIGDQRLRIEAQLSSVREDHRASHLFDTKLAASALGCSANKFGTYWNRTDGKLVELAIYQPAALAAEICSIFARAAVERDRRIERAQRDHALYRPPRGDPP